MIVGIWLVGAGQLHVGEQVQALHSSPHVTRVTCPGSGEELMDGQINLRCQQRNVWDLIRLDWSDITLPGSAQAEMFLISDPE